MVLLAIGQVFYVIFGLTDQFFLMTQRQIFWFKISCVIFVFTVALDTILIPEQGLIGASMVSSLMLLTLGTISTIAFRSFFGVWLFDVYHVKILLASAISIIATLIVTDRLDLNPIPNIVLSFFLSILLFLFFLWITGMESSDKLIISQSLGKLFQLTLRKPS